MLLKSMTQQTVMKLYASVAKGSTLGWINCRIGIFLNNLTVYKATILPVVLNYSIIGIDVFIEIVSNE